ncbi:hypothetical protein CEXT_55051 [Caerostris extrusa]|uniref:Uncharacterized protein n=1 Tax=Caerostris extrusa TaxID=172846 RepID=A0AAV4P423_CAEEX|nr:hypothetical protein CEXT_55051 [Caerostris extrusa]
MTAKSIWSFAIIELIGIGDGHRHFAPEHALRQPLSKTNSAKILYGAGLSFPVCRRYHLKRLMLFNEADILCESRD